MKTSARDTTKGRTLKNQEWEAVAVEVSIPSVVVDSNFTLLLMAASLVGDFPAVAVVMNFIFDSKIVSILKFFLGKAIALISSRDHSYNVD